MPTAGGVAARPPTADRTLSMARWCTAPCCRQPGRSRPGREATTAGASWWLAVRTPMAWSTVAWPSGNCVSRLRGWRPSAPYDRPKKESCPDRRRAATARSPAPGGRSRRRQVCRQARTAARERSSSLVSIQGQGFLYACPLPGRQDTLSTAAQITHVGWGSHADQPRSGVGAERPGHGPVSWSGFLWSLQHLGSEVAMDVAFVGPGGPRATGSWSKNGRHASYLWIKE